MEIENQEQKKIGQRIKSARVLTGLNQVEFARDQGFNHTSLRNWEFGRVSPRLDAVKKLVESFKNFGVFIYPEWILSGAGEGPLLTNSEHPIKHVSNDNLLIKTFRKFIDDSGRKSIITTVNNDDMMPLFKMGDTVCGWAITIHELQGWAGAKIKTRLANPLLVKCANDEFQPRWLNFDGKKWWSRGQDFSLVPLNSDIIGIIKMRIYGSETDCES